MEYFDLRSRGGDDLHCCKWTPEGEIRGTVQLIHGVAEHIGRYDAFARFLNANGYQVVAADHMGHGGSIGLHGTRGYFNGGWMTAVADVHALYEYAKQSAPELPYFMFGHSMGSFLLRTYLYTYNEPLAGAVLSGTNWEAPIKLSSGLSLCKLEEFRLGEKQTSKLLNGIMFGAYNKPFRPNRTTHDWISSVGEVVDAYLQDPLCGFDVTVGLARDMLTGIRMNEQPENLRKMNPELPILFVSGEKDPVGGMGSGVLACVDAFKRSGMQNVRLKLYPDGRHEMLNEVNRDEVMQDVLDWLTSHS